MLKRIYQHFFLIATVLFAVLGFFFLNRLGGDSAKVSDMASLIVCVAFFGVCAISGYLEDLGSKLHKWQEQKTGYAPNASPPIAPYPERNHRDDLNHSLIGSLGICLSNRGMDANGIGEFIRKTADAILGNSQSANAKHKCLIHGTAVCSCGPNQGCTNCPTAGSKADQAAEAEIVAKGLTAPRVTAEQIQALMAKLTWHYEQPKGTTSTFAHAYLGRFFLTTGHSACVSPENFDAALGMKYAREQAEGKAREKLWELEGYVLYSFPQLAHSRTAVA